MTTPHPDAPAEGPDDPEVTEEPQTEGEPQTPPPSEDPVRPQSDPLT